MAVRKINVERFRIVSRKSFGEVLSAVERQVGHPEIRHLLGEVSAAKTEAEVEKIVGENVGPTNLMEFARFNQGEVLSKETGASGPQMLRLLLGNPVTMKKMARYTHDAGSYAPVTILIDERPEGVYLSYDRMASFLAPYGEPAAIEVAKELDATVESMLATAAG